MELPSLTILGPLEHCHANPDAFRNVVRDQSTCRVCATPVHGYTTCWRCSEYRSEPGVADIVAPLVYAIGGTESAATLRNYKNHPNRARRERSA